MQEKLNLTDYARQVRKISRTLMCSGESIAQISGRIHLLTVATERDLVRFADPVEASRVACGPGCGSCCILNVGVLLPEAIAISWFLQRRFSAKDLATLRDRLKELLRLTRWLDDEERIFVREPCAFLSKEKSCMIHIVRPLLCRAITSTDPESCRDAINMAALDGVPSVEMNLFHKELVDTVYHELGGALQDLGLDYRPRRLSSAVLSLLADPKIVDRFLSGEQIPLQ